MWRRDKSASSIDQFEPALSSLNSSHASINSSYSYYHKQQDLIKLVQDTHSLLTGICADHRDERFPLLYPRSDQLSTCSEQLYARSEQRSRSRSSHRNIAGKFQLIGLTGTRTGNNNVMAAHDLSVLEESSLGRLLLGRLEECREYLDRMMIRVRDRSSRVLITGDVNGGKSTLINALLQAPNMLPMDQQPCTQAFCEVIPLECSGENEQQQVTIHAIPDLDQYDPSKPSSFDQMSLSRMQSTVQEEDTPYQWYRITLPITIPYTWCNQLVQVSLIDSPGLNSDLFKTMNLFTRQEEIDVIVFVINAANHLTLSAREFLETAGRDKAYIFIIVNKFDDIRNKEKCRRIILQQISEVLPATGAEGNDLIHFISAKQELSVHDDGIPLTRVSEDAEKTGCQDSAFDRLQSCLADFILSKRTKSKLLPAKTYLVNLLGDLKILLEHNERNCQEELIQVRREIDVLTPCYEELAKHEAPLRQDLLHGVTDASNVIYTKTSNALKGMEERIKARVNAEQWRGLWGIWAWRRSIVAGVDGEAGRVVGEARAVARETVAVSQAYLHSTAQSHAASVYMSSGSFDMSASKPDFEDGPDQSLVNLPTWSILDVSTLISPLSTLSAALKTLLTGAGSIAGTSLIIGHANLQSAVLSNARRRPGLVLASLCMVAAIFLGLTCDLERAARSRLVGLLADHYCQPAWLHSHAHAIESVCHQHVMAIAGQLLSRFQEALAQQRRLRAEKDLQRAQLAARLEQVVGQSRRISQLYDQVGHLVL